MSSRNLARLAAIVAGAAALAAGSAATFAASSSQSSAPSDAQITQQVKQKLARDLQGGIVNLQVQTQDGVVTLSGRASTGLAQLRALQEARLVPGVTDVKNNLRVTM